MKKLKLVSSIALVAGALAAPVHAETEIQVIGIITLDSIQGGSSNTSKVIVGPSNVDFPPYHTIGQAGIANEFFVPSNKKVDVAGLAVAAPVDNNGVHSLNVPYHGAPTSHNDLGVFHFARAGANDVWYGEWSRTGAVDDPTHTVYYVGGNADAAITRTGTATYTVTGINHYAAAANNLLKGTFTADFSGLTLTGFMLSTDLYINIGSAKINSDGASIANGGEFAPFAIIASTQHIEREGIVAGQFYNGQADLAGMVTFATNPALNTAFGGVRTLSPVIIVH